MAAVVLCMDVSLTMNNSFKVITMFVQRQVFAENKNEIALVLFGTDGTDNPLSGDDQYQHITVHRHLMLRKFDLLEDIESKIEPVSQQAHFLDTLIMSIDVIQHETIGKKFEKRHIEIFTDFSSQFSKSQLDIIMHSLKKCDISLQFLPFSVGKEDGSGDRGGGNFHLGGHGPSFPLKGIAEQQKGLEIVRMVMIFLEGEDGLDEIYSCSESLRKLCVFKKIERHSIHWPYLLTIVYCLNDDDETKVLKKGFHYERDTPFFKVDEEQVKYKSEGSASVLGFCKSSQVQRKFFMGNQVLKVFAARDDEAAAVAFSSLIHVLDELDMVAIVHYAYDKRANPQVRVAFPHIKHNHECLVYVQLPFMEDLQQYMFLSLKNSKNYLNAVDALIDSMSLVKKDEKTDILEDLFPTTQIPYSLFQKLFQCLLHRALHFWEPLPPIQQRIWNMLNPPTEVTVKCQIPFSKIKILFLLIEAKKKDQVNTEKGGGAHFRVSSLAEGSVTSAGSVNPAENFHVLVKQKNANFEEASDQLINHIKQFLVTNEIPSFTKSVDRIRAFQEEAVKFSDQCFNNFLKKVEIKQLNHFWEIVVQDGITLITKEEASGRSVTAEEAKNFLAPKEKPNEDTAAIFEEGGDVDDLLDMI
uniref:X-ray repair cross-complementing protein 5 n=1 Tax=Saimiri boliviensis boliviensis TaxID=39432 RepID=A0A2K6SEN0_SAIBB